MRGRNADLRRVLDDAMTAAYAADAARTRRLLLLACRISADDPSEVLAAADAVRGVVDFTAAPDHTIPRSEMPLTVLRLRLPPGRDLTTIGRAPTPQATAPAFPVPRPVPRRLHKRARLKVGVIAGIALVVAFQMLEIVPQAVELREDPTGSRAAELLRARGEAALVAGDSAEAVGHLLASAAADGPPGEVAWRAALALARLPHQEGAAAEAFVRAYAAGVSPERWPRIAEALDCAGRSEEANRLRVRAQLESSPVGR